jgi:hypothetical protein
VLVSAHQVSAVLIELFRVMVVISKAGLPATPRAAQAATATTVAGGRADGDVTVHTSTVATATVTAATATPTLTAATMSTADTPDGAFWFAPGTEAGCMMHRGTGIGVRYPNFSSAKRAISKRLVRIALDRLWLSLRRRRRY